MKTVHLISGGDAGGARTHVLRLLGELNKTGQAHLFALGGGALADDARERGIPCETLTGGFFAQLRAAKRYIRSGGCDLVRCHGSRANMIGAPGIKGVWTGDYFEFTLPVKKFAAGTSVTLTFPMYTRQGPVFWYIEYLDGEEWKCNKETVTCYDPAYSMECTYSLVRGGKVIEHTMTFENEVKSGELKFRIKCADGSIQADTDTKVAVRNTPWVSSSAYAAPFYLYLEGSDVTSVTFSTN